MNYPVQPRGPPLLVVQYHNLAKSQVTKTIYTRARGMIQIRTCTIIGLKHLMCLSLSQCSLVWSSLKQAFFAVCVVGFQPDWRLLQVQRASPPSCSTQPDTTAHALPSAAHVDSWQLQHPQIRSHELPRDHQHEIKAYGHQCLTSSTSPRTSSTAWWIQYIVCFYSIKMWNENWLYTSHFLSFLCFLDSFSAIMQRRMCVKKIIGETQFDILLF